MTLDELDCPVLKLRFLPQVYVTLDELDCPVIKLRVYVTLDELDSCTKTRYM